MTHGIIVVGASVGGVRVVQGLRSRGYRGPIHLVDQEPGEPYDKPPLSKAFLTQEQLPGIALVPAQELRTLDVNLLSATTALGVDPQASCLFTSAGDLQFDQLVVATGSAPRTVPAFVGIAGATVLRTRADALVVRAAITARRPVVVLGGGFIGAEVASSARAYGLPVTLVEVADRLMSRALPAETSAALAELHRRHGVELALGATATPYAPRGHIEGVVLSDGRTIEAGLVVVGVGAVPAVEWLLGSLGVSDGLECESSMRVRGTSNVWAVGDVARWWNPRFQAVMRVEHWTSAREQAVVVAHNIVTGEDRECDLLPFVWSDQHGSRIQHAGFADGDVDVVEEPAGREVKIFTYHKDGLLVGATGINAAAKMSRLRRQLLAQVPVKDPA